jgi:hypothetical protein
MLNLSLVGHGIALNIGENTRVVPLTLCKKYFSIFSCYIPDIWKNGTVEGKSPAIRAAPRPIWYHIIRSISTIALTLGAGYFLHKYWYERYQSMLINKWQEEIIQQLPNCPYNGAWFFQKAHAKKPFDEFSQTMLKELLTTKVDQSVPYLLSAIADAKKVIAKVRILDGTGQGFFSSDIILSAIVSVITTIVGVIILAYEKSVVGEHGYSILRGSNPCMHILALIDRIQNDWDGSNAYYKVTCDEGL